jgi:hypothetical protein
VLSSSERRLETPYTLARRLPGGLDVANYNLVQCVFNRQDLSPDEDVAVITMHIREVVQGAPDILPVTDQGRDNFISRLNTWWTTIRPLFTDKISLWEARFYDVPSQPGVDMGDPVKLHSFYALGTATGGPMPPQMACSVTFKTDKRKTWGRFYLPGLSKVAIDPNGRLERTYAQTLVAATHGLTSRSGTGAALVVFSRSEWTHHDPQTIQVDDIFDVIRSRRYKAPLYRETLSAG